MFEKSFKYGDGANCWCYVGTNAESLFIDFCAVSYLCELLKLLLNHARRMTDYFLLEFIVNLLILFVVWCVYCCVSLWPYQASNWGFSLVEVLLKCTACVQPDLLFSDNWWFDFFDEISDASFRHIFMRKIVKDIWIQFCILSTNS
jgi:hypothetical protein